MNVTEKDIRIIRAKFSKHEDYLEDDKKRNALEHSRHSYNPEKMYYHQENYQLHEDSSVQYESTVNTDFNCDGAEDMRIIRKSVQK